MIYKTDLMPNYLELQYISPVSNYKFNKNNLHILVISSVGSDNKIRIYKTVVKDLNNINNIVRGYKINKALSPLPSLHHQSLNAKLYAYNRDDDKIKLLFSGMIHLDKLEEGNINYIELQRTVYRTLKFNNDSDFTNEKFFKLEKTNNQDKVFLYISNVPYTELPVMKATEIDYDNLPGKLWAYDRYQNTVTQEFVPANIKNNLESSTKIQKLNGITNQFIENYIKGKNNFDGYMHFSKVYQKDDKHLLEYDRDISFKDAISRKFKPGMRPLKYEPYLNSIISCPVDGKIRAFYINQDLKIAAGNKIFQPKNLVSKPFQYHGGGGYISRVTPNDYQRVHVPYAAYLKEVGIFGGSNNEQYLVSLRFETPYFIPQDVHQRDLISVIYGNDTYGGVGVGAGLRPYPEMKLPQPETYLIYNVIIVAPSYEDAFKFTNEKLYDIKQYIGNNKNKRVRTVWFETGEEIGKLSYGYSNVIFMCNRPIEFANDIKFNSKISKNAPLKNPIDTYVRSRDLVGILL